MKRGGILNRDVCALIASLGHTDLICIADAGLPIPPGVSRIDLALVCGVPAFLETLQAVLTDLVVEHATVAREMRGANPGVYQGVRSALAGIPVEEISHEELKNRTGGARAAIRTGECTPYANILLRSGVAF